MKRVTQSFTIRRRKHFHFFHSFFSGLNMAKTTTERSSLSDELNLNEAVEQFQPRKLRGVLNCSEAGTPPPDDPAAKDKQQLTREKNLRTFSENNERQKARAKLDREALTLYLRYIINSNDGVRGLKSMRKFKKYANTQNVKVPSISESTLLSRFLKQALEPFISRQDTFDLTSNEISILRKKLK